MDLKNIREMLARLTAMVDGWASGETVGALERDWALEKLRALYEAIRFADLSDEAKPVPAPVETESTPGSERPSEDTAVENAGLDLSGMLALEPEPVESETEPEPEPELAPASVSEPEPESESESESAISGHSVFVEEPVSVEPLAPVILAVPQPETESVAELQSESVVATVPEPETVPAPVPVPESECEPVSAPEPEPLEQTSKQPETVVQETTLFGTKEEDDAMRHRRKQRVIMSLYGDEAGVRSDSESGPAARPVHSGRVGRAATEQKDAVTFEEISVETVVSDDPMPMSGFATVDFPADRETSPAPAGNVLGEVINHDVKTLADTIEPPRDVATDLRRKAPVYDLRQAVGINDRFLLIRDLFGGDSEAYETLMQRLNTFESLDDCVIYLTENYTWNANSDSVRLLMELLERKFA